MDPGGFSSGVGPKLNWSGLSLTLCSGVSTSKIIHHSLCFSFPCSQPNIHSSLFLHFSPLVSTPLSPSLLPFPVAGNSHNCRPKFPSLAGGSGVWHGWVWMLSSSGSLSAASKQRMLLPTSKGSASNTVNWRLRDRIQLSPRLGLWSQQIEEKAGPSTAVSSDGLSGVRQSSLGLSSLTVKQH